MDLHTPTILLLIVMVSAVLSGALAFIAYRNHREAVFWALALALALHAVAYALFALRGQVSDLVSIVLANATLSAHFAVFTEGLYRFQRRPPPRLLVWGPVLLVLASGTLFLALPAPREVLSALVIAAQAGLVLAALWWGLARTAGRGQYLLIAGEALVVAVALQRTVSVLTGSADFAAVSSSAVVPAPGFAAVVVSLLLVALGLVSMTQERAEAALQASQAYEHFRSELLDRLSRGEPLARVLTAFADGVEQLRPGTWCALSLHGALGERLGVVEARALPGAAGVPLARVMAGAHETSPQGADFTARATQAGLAARRLQPVLASDRQRLGTLALYSRAAEAPWAADAALAEELATLAGLAIERCSDARRMRESEQQYRELIESANEGICVLQGGSLRYVNPKMRELSGYSEAELVGRPFLDFVHFADRALALRNHDKRMHGQGENLRYPLRLLTKHHGARWFEISGVRFDWQGQLSTLNFLTDITERKLESDLVHELAYHDTLTGLPNRRLLLDHLQLALASNRRTGRHGALLFMDLDNFKPLNDHHGHTVGDLLLVEVARRLRRCVREMDTVARFGGDEFVVLLIGLGENVQVARAQAAAVAEKARQALAEPYRLALQHTERVSTVEHQCSASIGVKMFAGTDEQEGAGEALLDDADAAMYQAKQAGCNTVCFDPQPVA